MGDDDDNVNDDGGEDNNHLRDVEEEEGGECRKSEQKKRSFELEDNVESLDLVSCAWTEYNNDESLRDC